MSIVVTVNNMSLDGVMQAPGRADEDPRGGFGHGGWARPYGDEVAGRVMGEGMSRTRALVLGRRTYEDFFSFWPGQRDNPFTEVLAATPKYVASRTLREPLPWANSVLMPGDATDEVARLREQPGGDLVVLGSGDLLRSLTRRGLVDRYILLIHPLVLGTGRRLFAEQGALGALRLVGSLTTTTGVVIATYEPVEPAAGAAGPA
ncbi:dihydrofolate reductase family protein [Streptosporangium sp. NPDC023615]|uniref:dihydrofolate reductase family protein n=1 Tax=Streptosporangium sp. NPDC023615 TaxID=3154794 RepID=UPI003418FD4B